MNVPKARKLASGTWFIQLRLGGESIPVSGATEKAVTREAMRIKAEYRAGMREQKKPLKSDYKDFTVDQAMKHYISTRPAETSPATLRGYDIIAAHRWQRIAGRKLFAIKPDEWQGIIDAEAALWAPKTLHNAWGLLKEAASAVGYKIPPVTLPKKRRSKEIVFLEPEQIPVFVKAIAPTKYAVGALLALCSARLSEILAIDWVDVPVSPDFIPVRGAVVQGRDNKMVKKDDNKTEASMRNIPVYIPELREVLERDRKETGSVSVSGGRLRDGINRVCEQSGLPLVGVHGLRHSFASLCYHLNVPERITMEIGGWSDINTVHRIYTHLAKSDISRYRDALGGFFVSKNS